MNYSVRSHPRARHVRLRVEPHGGLVVTVPSGFDRSRLPALIAERQGWIDRARQRLVRARPAAELAARKPARIELPAAGESWSVHYRAADRQRLTLDERDNALWVQGPEPHLDQEVAALLRNWLKQRARSFLLPRVQGLARRHGFSHGRITVRNQKSRWGSCSATGNLSLNARLLFLSPEACDYVLLHELVHTRHLNHSPAFWARVAEVAPAYRQAMAELKAAWLAMPAWVDG